MVNIEQETLLEILSMNQKEIEEYLKPFCNVSGEDFMAIYVDPSYPWLVAHIDVYYDWYYSYKGNQEITIEFEKEDVIYRSPNRLGADDRAGVYALLYLYSRGLKANFLFTDKEERGLVGAREFCDVMKTEINPPFFIAIDRRGYKEYVCYNNDEKNEMFISVIERYFNHEIGTSSDIKVIGHEFNVCSVNLSAGYYNQHKAGQEYLVYSHLKYTIEKISEIIKELGNKRYELFEKY